MAIRASWLPCSATAPRRKTTILSAPRMVESRCATTSTVRPVISESSADCTTCPTQHCFSAQQRFSRARKGCESQYIRAMYLSADPGISRREQICLGGTPLAASEPSTAQAQPRQHHPMRLVCTTQRTRCRLKAQQLHLLMMPSTSALCSGEIRNSVTRCANGKLMS